MIKEGESLVIGWCDNGSVDGLFASSVASIIMRASELGIKTIGITETIGNQIARQRGDLLREFENSGCDWLLWLDSDIVIPIESLKPLIEAVDAETRPIVCGVYFISMEPNQPLMAPLPCIFTDNGVYNSPIHPLPENQLIKIDVAGLGLCLMHKSVAHKLRDKYGNTTFDITIGDIHKSEDVSFFRKVKELGIQAYAHTGVLAWHIKRFVVDINYYNLWWNTVAPLRAKANEVKDGNAVSLPVRGPENEHDTGGTTSNPS